MPSQPIKMVSSKKLKTLFTKNFSFTPQERTVIIFLCAAFIAGIGLNLFSGNKPTEIHRQQFDYSSLDREFYEKSSPKNTAVTKDQRALHAVNHITEAQLIALPSIGKILARRIIEFRSNHGPLTSIDDLRAVPGIGSKRIRTIKQFLERENIK